MSQRPGIDHEKHDAFRPITVRCYAERGIATASRLSVRLSVFPSATLSYRDRKDRNPSKIISRLVS